MTGLQDHLHGLWLPLVTPFRDGALDERSLRRLTRHYSGQAVDGFILGATSGEGMTLRETELERLVAIVRDEMAAGRRTPPICLGLSGADTSRLKERLDETADWPIDGYLIASPYYVRPSQRGLLAHFEALADHAAWPIALYNIPYRTSVNITNQTLLRLAEHRNIVGLKDCGANREQSIALLRDRPKGQSPIDALRALIVKLSDQKHPLSHIDRQMVGWWRVIAGEGASRADIESVRRTYGFDRPVAVRYFQWLGNAASGNLGDSYRQRRPVINIVRERLPVTVGLACLALAISLAISLPLAIAAAVKRNSVWDRLALAISVIGQAVPAFWIAGASAFTREIRLRGSLSRSRTSTAATSAAASRAGSVSTSCEGSSTSGVAR